MSDPWKEPSGSKGLGSLRSIEIIGAGVFPLATFGQRALAWLIDIVILAAIGEIFTRINPKEANGLSALVDLGYMVLLLGGPFGQTIGAKIARVRVVDMQGKPLGYLRATARYFVSGISAIVLGLGYLWMLRDNNNQTIHDKVAGSLVISLVPRAGLEPMDIDNPGAVS